MPVPSPGDLPDPGIGPESPASAALAGGFLPAERPGKPVLTGRKIIFSEHSVCVAHVSDDTSDAPWGQF